MGLQIRERAMGRRLVRRSREEPIDRCVGYAPSTSFVSGSRGLCAREGVLVHVETVVMDAD